MNICFVVIFETVLRRAERINFVQLLDVCFDFLYVCCINWIVLAIL